MSQIARRGDLEYTADQLRAYGDARAAEMREQCAQACAAIHAQHVAAYGDYLGDTYAVECAAAIRALPIRRQAVSTPVEKAVRNLEAYKVERTRFLASAQDDVHSVAISEAADLIDRQAARIAELEAAAPTSERVAPLGYAYEYSDGLLRFDTGRREINGSRPVKAIKLYAHPPTLRALSVDDIWNSRDIMACNGALLGLTMHQLEQAVRAVGKALAIHNGMRLEDADRCCATSGATRMMRR